MRWSSGSCQPLAHAIAAALVVSLAGTAPQFARAGEYESPKPAPLPSLHPTVPPGEKMFYDLERDLVPGVRVWSMNCKGDMWVYGTSESVGDGAALRIYVPADGETGMLCSYDTGVQNDFKDYKGLSLWFKGDGSDATAILTTDYAGSKARFAIPMNDTNWRKVIVPWEKMGLTGGFWFLTYGMERADKGRANWYVVDRVHLYKQEKVEEITPTPDADPPGMIPAKAFVSGRENITKTLAKLKEKKPVKIVIAGDSIPCGAQLWYAGPDAVKRIYWNVLGQRLKEFYQYPDVSLVMHAFSKPDKNAEGQWKDTPEKRPTADLQVVGVVAGGAMASAGLQHIDQILAEKPDLVIWEYGANDATFCSRGQFSKATAEALGKLQEAGIELALQTITPSPGITPVTWMANKSSSQRVAELNQESRRIAAEKKVALADMERAFVCRGILFVGTLYADNVHPNHLGHEMMADVLDALLTDRDVRIWRYGPAAGRSQAGR